MGIAAWLDRIAAAGQAPVFAIAGIGARDSVEALRLRPELRLVDTPAAATILLVAGSIPSAWLDPIARVHDALAMPRATMLWGDAAAGALSKAYPDAVAVDGDPVPTAVRTFRDLMTRRRASEGPVLPDVDPAPWRGIGPYGQGGSGMTGGTPYGRPMAELGPDPDGLRLDVLPLSVGPLFPRFPAGLALDVRWSGELVLEATARAELDATAPTTLAPADLRPFLAALDAPVSIRTLEMARARSHLRWLFRALRGSGLDALALRALRVADTLAPGDVRPIRRLASSVERSQVLRWAAKDVGRIDAAALDGMGAGPAARAAGLRDDVRSDDPSYRDLGFEPVLRKTGDAAARWRVRLAEVGQSLELAAAAGDRRTGLIGRVESPRGRLAHGDAAAARLLSVASGALTESDWGDAVTTIVSLDLDLEEMAFSGVMAAQERVA